MVVVVAVKRPMKKMTVYLSALCVAGLIQTASGQTAEAIRPISNPVFFDSPEVQTLVHPIFIHQNHPSKLNTEIGAIPADGGFQLYALQFEFAFTENLSLIAVKDGFIDFNPDETLSKESGLADVAAGLKYVFWRNDAETRLASVRGVYEIPLGDDDVWHGEGNGTLNPGISILCTEKAVQMATTAGGIFGVNSEKSDLLYASAHASMEVVENLFPLIELNYFRTISNGDGGTWFGAQVDGAVPSVVQFEGSDLVNFGASNAKDNADFVTLALGARYRLSDMVDLGAAFEIPLTEEQDSILENRITVDAIFRF